MTDNKINNIIRPRPVQDPELRLFVLHHAGGSHAPFRSWARLLPAEWELCLVDAPGRVARPGPPCRSAAELAERFLDDFRPLMDRPYALFGHSMGAIAAYETALAVHERGLPLPQWLGLSAISAPEHHPRGTRRFALPDDGLREAVLRLGGTPREVLEDPELWAFFSPIMRADFELSETWRPRRDAPALPVPLSVFVADGDAGVPLSRTEGWAATSTRFLGTRVFSGDHFYFQPDPAALVDAVVAGIRAVAPVH
ncbi:thioesterase II family protein [Streptomyces sp. QH1-20]|uniref:thioesterase II family protein n=1 Tax=Streptomyces sp. QH1-20 TaxID=3240934 RepID=UPI003516CD80